MALSVDEPSDLASAVAKLKEMRFPFYSAPAPRQLVMLLQWYHDALTQQEQPMPIPVSFLIDAEGRLAALYKERVEVNDVVADLGHAMQAITTAQSEHLDDIAKTIEQRLSLYGQSQPYHDSAN